MRQVFTRRCLLFFFPLSAFSVFFTLYSDGLVTTFIPLPTESTSDGSSVEQNVEIVNRSWLPWYMSGGEGGLSSVKGKLFPEDDPLSDRIEEQLTYAPVTNETKLILAYNGDDGWSPWTDWKAGSSYFSSCPVNSCTITKDKNLSRKADAILFRNQFQNPGITRPSRQVWILFMMESPYHTPFIEESDVFNWTVTYRWDSDIVYPYEKWVYYNDSVTSLPLTKNYAANKTKQVAWFASNCNAKNYRLEYAYELQKYISVDIFGACGSEECPRYNSKKCFDMLNTDYKFYLSFENSNCKDYITEKFFTNGLKHDIIPIVMGARPEDYDRAAPRNSFIHVNEFDSPKNLAQYLHKLDKYDDLYNNYFRWKGTGEFINNHFYCRLCSLLHGNFPAKTYKDINSWWRGSGVCSTDLQGLGLEDIKPFIHLHKLVNVYVILIFIILLIFLFFIFQFLRPN